MALPIAPTAPQQIGVSIEGGTPIDVQAIKEAAKLAAKDMEGQPQQETMGIGSGGGNADPSALLKVAGQNTEESPACCDQCCAGCCDLVMTIFCLS